MSYLEHGVWWLNSLFTLLAEVKFISDGTLVSYSQNRISSATVANDVAVNNFGLLFPLLLEMGGEKQLILSGAVRLYFVAQDLFEFLEKLIVQSSCSIALLAWKSVLVNHFSITLKALGEILKVSGGWLPDHIFWSKDEATHHFLVSDHIFLAGLRLGDDLGVAHSVLGNCFALGCNLVCIDICSDIFVKGVDAIGVASKTVLDFLGSQILHHISSIGGLSGASCHFVISACD